MIKTWLRSKLVSSDRQRVTIRFKLDSIKMKVEYHEGGGALRSGKIQPRWKLDTGKMEVR